MQLVIKNNIVITTHEDGQIIAHLYPGCDIISWNKPIQQLDPLNGITEIADPRSKEDMINAYKDQRRIKYPSIQDQLDMLYWDKINNTTTWQDTITAVKNKYPKPKS
jgi:hypothetical protein